ncbi:DNA gyrase subunit A [Prochlorococcus marinus str. XMU1401]|uniref:DNA topoisomerase (ATP-hydrolyzing) n=1 Tax=Prochlorococcus marinus str. XMU1401 TaxID=2052594 RepID=A0A8I1X1W9_PROMR|nr:DNA topoisomerase (ATP-hydrolyzing) [Prochlorococcus marinus]MBO8221894.1 DNA topoisomerase 4 subunit A [Prochlorococcus marinus str. XMU1401]MBW3060275.1 DNA gyrase subunit A [Prochlorococcus marinus str. XMU1401E]PJC83144.1 DNA gyrase subunit A [Prochlorococcus marinus str. XMU1401]
MDKKNFTSISLQEEMQRSYLEYAMSVIVGRALPDARDGLKPVQRRIIFAMYELGLTPDKPFRKCARVVGDVLGKYHPHGDQAVYDALVKLVQNFSTKYPTLDGHGNFGSVDNDPPAAMRYTETRLAPIAHKGFLEEIGSETVNFSNNFDGSQKEPDVLPAQLPFLLLNGSSGIAVGMATNIPPHNLGEIVDGLVALIKNKDISDKKLSNIIKGPDFPTGGELIYSQAIEELYQTGKGSITIRGVVNTEEVNLGKGKHKKNAIIITELPYQINKAGWIEKLAELVNSGKIIGISDIRDESDRDGMRIVIELKKDSNSELVISNLYKKTTLQTNFGAIFLALIEGKPVQLNLKKYLNNFLEFREETIRKRTFYFLKNTLDKLEISEGLSKATKNIKKVIAIIEESDNSVQAKSKLIEKFFLSEKQANSVLDMPLKKLTNLEKNQIDNDIKNLEEKKNYFQKLLNERELLLELLIEELLVLKKKYNVIRKTKIIKNINQNEELETLNNQILEDFINKKTKLYVDNRLYLKKMLLSNYKKSFEVVNKIIDNKNIQKFICNIEKNIKLIGITNTGKVFNIDWESSINKDYKLDNKILGNIHPNEIINFHSIKKETRNYLCILNSDGKFKKVLFDEDMIKSNRSFTITKLKNNLKTIDSFISNESKNLIILTSIGRIFKFNLSNKFLTPTSKQSQGLIIAKLLPSEKIVSCCTFNDGENIFLISKKGKIFCINSNEIYCSNEYSLGYLNEKTQLKNDYFLKIMASNHYLDIETNKNKSARLDLNKLNYKSNKSNFLIDFFKLDNDEYIENCFRLENFLD